MSDGTNLAQSLEETNRSSSGLLGELSSPLNKDGGQQMGADAGERVEGTGAETGKIATTVSHSSNVSNEASHKSAPMNLLTDKKASKEYEQNMASTLPKDIKVSEEVEELISQTYVDEKTGLEHYKVPRHFAQVGNRKGATIYIPTFTKAGGQQTINITFENGTYTATEINLVKALQQAITRKSGAGNIIKEITKAHYANILASERHASKLRGIGGLVSTRDTSPATGGKTAAELMRDNEELERKLAEMQAQIETINNEATAKNNALFKK